MSKKPAWLERPDLAKRIKGRFMFGDGDVPPTHAWNVWVLRTFFWKWTVFRVPFNEARRGYQVGFIPDQGMPQVKDEVGHSSHFAMRIGRENCTFFAIRPDGSEIEIELVTTTPLGFFEIRRTEAQLH